MSSVAGHKPAPSRPGSSRPSSRASTRPATERPSPSAGILTPSNDAILNRPQTQGSSGSASGKRKRDGPSLGADSLLKAPIVLKAHPSKLTVKPRILHPLMLLPREHLPLSALDLSQPQGDFPASRLFESGIKILDLEGRLGSSVLLARSETNRMVYAVEQESNGLYVLCKLGAWVDVEGLAENATVVCRERLRGAKRTKTEDTSAAPLTTPLLYKESKRRRLAIEEIQSLVRRRSASTTEQPQKEASTAPEERLVSNSLDSEPADTPEEHIEPPIQPCLSTPSKKNVSTTEPPADEPPAQPVAEEIFMNIRTQYVEALYHSKGSLAYFAKGPLSRARAAFHQNDANLQMNDLVDFLKSLVTTTVLIDKKYRETIPEIVAKMKTLVEESEKGAPVGKKKKKAKKPRLGKDGLYPGEVDHIRRWSTAHQPAPSGDDEKIPTAAETKYHISCLRRRETQLQMIIILEILALESLAQPKPAAEESQLPGVESQAPSREGSQEPSVRKRNKHNLPVLLDVHADRLCIWQSTTLDEVKALAESQVLADGMPTEKPHSANSDPLRDFCVDIVIPFFSARLPGPCDTLNRKLGGPVAHSPPKAKIAKPAAAAKPKPGAPIQRATALRRGKDRTLERALSVERSRRSVSRGPADAIALMRSASNTVIPGLKREVSEPSLMGLPRADQGSLKERPKNVFSRSVSLSGTEDWRAKKKAHVEAELKDAISALKKPNRTLAVKEFVEAAEKRASAGQLKKLKKPNHASTVQVKATPANNRFKDVLASSNHHSQPALPFFDLPPSSASVVPASTLPRKFTNRLPTNPSDFAIQATPARAAPGTGLLHPETPGIPTSSPIMVRKSGSGLFATAAGQAPAAATRTGAGSRSSGSGAATQPAYLPVPSSTDRHSRDLVLPSSPGMGLAGLFETPLAPRARASGGGGRGFVVDDTPIRSRLLFPVSGNNNGGGNNTNRAKGSGSGSEFGVETGIGKENGRADDGLGVEGAGSVKEDYGEDERRGEEVSIYQRLGWDMTDFDDI